MSQRGGGGCCAVIEPEENSPNWGWAQLGFTIEREGPTNALRTIRDQAGNVVLHHPGYDEEHKWPVERGVIAK